MDSRIFSHEIEEDKKKGHVSQTNPKTTRTYYSIPNGSDDESAIPAMNSYSPSWPQLEGPPAMISNPPSWPQLEGPPAMISNPPSWPQLEVLQPGQVRDEVGRSFASPRTCFLLSSSNNQLGNHQDGEGMATGSENYKLCFRNQTHSIIFTNNEMAAKNGEPLQVALIDVNNSIVSMGPLSMAQLEFVVLDGDLSEFDDKSILTQRTGKRPLLVGNDLKINLKNGVGLIKSLSITDNSSWLRSKQFRLGIRIADDTILAKFPRIEEAVSQPFRVLDHRGEATKKHCPPKREYKVWRLKGIGKNGVYHKKLASEGIETVDDFLKIYYEKGPTYLKKLLGNRFPKKTWKEIEKSLECVDPEVLTWS